MWWISGRKYSLWCDENKYYRILRVPRPFRRVKSCAGSFSRGGQLAYAIRVAVLAQKRLVERVAAVAFDLGRELKTAVLALVALDMVAVVHRHNAVTLVLALLGRDRLLTCGTTWCVLPVAAIGRYCGKHSS